MRATTAKRYAQIREAAGELYGKMSVMRVYLELGERFGLSDERIRKILAQPKKKAVPK